MNQAQLLKKIRTIDIKTKGWVDSIFNGAYHTRFKGQGVQFSDVRHYAYGDDVRRIDWAVTAKLNEPYVKEFEEERELTMLLAIDISQSQFYQSTNESKLDRALEIAAILGFSAVNNGDQVGLMLFTDTIERYIPPKQGKNHMYAILTHLLNHQSASNQTSLQKVCHTILTTARRRCIVILLSDFIDDNYDSEFQRLAKKHDVVPIIIQDPIEYMIPPTGAVALKDTESGDVVVCNPKDPEFRASISSVLNSHRQRRQRLFQSVGILPIQLETTQSAIEPLRAYFRSR